MILIYKRGEVSDSEIFARENEGMDVSAAVSDIIANVRANGDRALREYSEKFDRAKLDALEVSDEEIEEDIFILLDWGPISSFHLF